MKRFYIFITILFANSSMFAQTRQVDSVIQLLNKQTTDTGKVRQLMALGSLLDFGMLKGDSTLMYLEQAVELSKKTGDIQLETESVYHLSNYLVRTANYPRALLLCLDNLKKLEQLKEEKNISIKFRKDRDLLFYQTRLLVFIYSNINDLDKQLEYIKKMQTIYYASLAKEPGANNYQSTIYYNLANAYSNLKMPDSSFHYRWLLYQKALKTNDDQWYALASGALGDHYEQHNNLDSAMMLFRSCIPAAEKSGRTDLVVNGELHIGSLFQKKAMKDSALFYTRQAMQRLSALNEPKSLVDAYLQLSNIYKDNKQYDSAYKYVQNFITLKDSLLDQTKITEAQNFVFNQTLRDQQVEQAKKETRQQAATRIKFYALAAIIAFALLATILLMRNLRNKRAANNLLTQQKEEIQTNLAALKAAQSQLIQSEKMASLGELTAGIAHEIQNPLNFVNNFSEINKELIEEVRSHPAISGTKLKADELYGLLEDIAANEEKINHHGRRADAIVKGMLQHSQTAKGQKEPTDINALCDEYLRLSYHGLRAKDKSFNATLATAYDNAIGKVNVIPQDMGRVLLNLFNNAFYALNDRSALQRKEQGTIYEPIISVTTKRTGDTIEIKIADNGSGIPPDLSGKIFQPFFTTKPTGQGTGLGLSLSYDIMKAHQGTIRLQPPEKTSDLNDIRTIFILELPTN